MKKQLVVLILEKGTSNVFELKPIICTNCTETQENVECTKIFAFLRMYRHLETICGRGNDFHPKDSPQDSTF
jgi:hypothetical protein